MGLFEFKDEEASRLHRELVALTNGTEPCYDPNLVDNPVKSKIYESHTDEWVENYTNRGVSAAKAEEMCAGCHVIEECLAFALANEESNGIWGGTNPRQRGFYKGKKIK